MAESLEAAPNKKRDSAAKHASIAAFHAVEDFLLSLTDALDDGRVTLSLEAGDSVVVKYVLLNPAERFADVVNSARAVVLAGGTMEPVSNFYRQLFPSISRDRLVHLSCAHVIPKSNLLTQVVSRGPRKTSSSLSLPTAATTVSWLSWAPSSSRLQGSYPTALWFCTLLRVPRQVKTAWAGSTGVLAKLGQKKRVFYESQTAADVDATLTETVPSLSRR